MRDQTPHKSTLNSRAHRAHHNPCGWLRFNKPPCAPDCILPMYLVLSESSPFRCFGAIRFSSETSQATIQETEDHTLSEGSFKNSLLPCFLVEKLWQDSSSLSFAELNSHHLIPSSLPSSDQHNPRAVRTLEDSKTFPRVILS